MEDIKIAFGKRVKELRLQKGISQEKLANIAGVDRTYMTQVENGKRNISIENVRKICIALNVSISDFFDVNYLKEN
ncbi:helix-turn-helix domain-containing protein [Candidatus Stoquefichus sp. SB1]|uniref:helix-turn-helix domain-containing protein n=1 Tax=Candidatus Stoquefichus sp. SB1 TaxID=1658109 RepID=UPI00067F7359|nr:helix-turn-helix transcriptional regulator [Candidatus Stoquefichus sp. SB1]